MYFPLFPLFNFMSDGSSRYQNGKSVMKPTRLTKGEKMFRKLCLFAIVLSLLSTLTVRAAEVNQGSFDKENKTFTFVPVKDPESLAPIQFEAVKTIVLTDTKDLSKWSDGEGKPVTGWTIKDGVISRIGGKDDLFYPGNFSDFILEFEFKVSKGGNSGVFYYSWIRNHKARGFEYQIIDDINRRVHPTMERFSTAGLYTLYHRAYNAGPMILNGYNKGKIVILGDHIEHWLNGKLAVSVQMNTENWKRHLAASRLNEDPNFGLMTTGSIAFQNHDHEVWYKNIRLTLFKKTAPEKKK